jgi:hypothetical protein
MISPLPFWAVVMPMARPSSSLRGRSFWEATWDLGKVYWPHCSPSEIIPSHGRKIQVSEILEFTQIDGYCNKFLWWLVGWYVGSPLVLGKSPLGVGCSWWMCFNMLSDQMATWLRTWLDQPWDLGAPFVQTKVSQTHIRVCIYIFI